MIKIFVYSTQALISWFDDTYALSSRWHFEGLNMILISSAPNTKVKPLNGW